jgi:hypothetical protein
MKFRCKQSGTVLEFKEQQDIDSMLKEEGYEAIKDDKAPEEPVKKAKTTKPTEAK